MFRQAIVEDLKSDLFRGAPIGQVIATEITSFWARSDFEMGFLSGVLAKGKFLYYMWFREWARLIYKRRRKWPEKIPKGTVSIEVHSHAEKMRGFWFPVANVLGPDQAVLLLSHSALIDGVPAGFSSVVMDELPIKWRKCRKYILSHLLRWRRHFRNTCRQFGLPRSAAWKIVNLLIVGILRIEEANNVIRLLAPSSFLTPWDHGRFGAPLTLAMHAKGIPTFTLVHGAVGHLSMIDFAPTLADYVLVWGRIQRDLFLSEGLPSSRVLVVGCPRMPRKTPFRRDARAGILNSLGLKESRLLILVAFTVLRGPRRDLWVSAVQRFVSSTPEATFILRIHPSQRKCDYESHFAEHERVAISAEGGPGLVESLGAIDVFVTDTSTSAFDALYQGNIVALLNPYSNQIRHDITQEMLDAGAAISCNSPEKLGKVIFSLFVVLEELASLREKQKKFLNDYLHATGDSAAKNIAREILGRQREYE